MGTYAALSGLMSSHPEVFIIRHYSQLHVKPLLYYQAELAELEKELEEIEKEDRVSTDVARRSFSAHWKGLTATGCSVLTVGDQAKFQDERSRLQWKLVIRIRDTLKDYDGITFHLTALLTYLELSQEKKAVTRRVTQYLWSLQDEAGQSYRHDNFEHVSRATDYDFILHQPAPDSTRPGSAIHRALCVRVGNSDWE